MICDTSMGTWVPRGCQCGDGAVSGSLLQLQDRGDRGTLSDGFIFDDII